MSEWKTFKANVWVSYQEEWIVEARNEDDARKRLECGETQERHSFLSDFQIETITELDEAQVLPFRRSASEPS